MERTSTKPINQNGTSLDGPDCERVNTILDQIIVGQDPTAEDEDYFINHAEDCSPCFDSLDKQNVFIGFLAQHVGRKGAPAKLSQTILAKLQTEMA
ncbi:hypothetical protein [Hymenobacter rubripertinctus]|uniref:Zinc-finger domain-containing protein n=1 Tax=Hymenobacter rubripertinctus TaxID=2029981 RepID=A0A418R9T7_9BACT|nr:hypothetical protein [Hymenobacter rubripertinctus]RIY14233.1 hypothetical protein D0T11_00675 [Hymenobacter rubripertinctus]